MAAVKINFHVAFRVIIAMLQHRPFQNTNTDRNEFKMFYEKECNILIAEFTLTFRYRKYLPRDLQIR